MSGDGRLADRAVPLRTLDPADPDLSDLEPLRDIVGDARVVALGESAHAVSEFYRFKHRALRFLVKELGFSAFVLESGFPEGLAVDAWVLGGPGDVAGVARTGVTYRFGDCVEMHDQLRWMREHNAAHDAKVRFYGMDVPGSGASPGPAIRACLERVAARPGDAELAELADLGRQLEAVARYQLLPPADRERLAAGVADLAVRAEESGDPVAIHCARSLLALQEVIPSAVRPPPEGRRPRDEFMAETVRWVLDRAERVVVSANNAHVQRGPGPGVPMLGGLLDDLGDGMVVVGTTYGSGRVVRIVPEGPQPTDWRVTLDELAPPPSHTADALLAGLGPPLHLVDLRGLPADRLDGTTAMLAKHDPVDISPADAFDALLYVDRVDTVAGAHEAIVDELEAARALYTPG